jgi:hypothetical protein
VNNSRWQNDEYENGMMSTGGVMNSAGCVTNVPMPAAPSTGSRPGTYGNLFLRVSASGDGLRKRNELDEPALLHAEAGPAPGRSAS